MPGAILFFRGAVDANEIVAEIGRLTEALKIELKKKMGKLRFYGPTWRRSSRITPSSAILWINNPGTSGD